MLRTDAVTVASGLPRLLAAPTMLLSAPRSGSTLLRAVLGSHSRLHAPHEITLNKITVDVPFGVVEGQLRQVRTRQDLEHLLWDRVLHAELQRSGKPRIVHKSPGDVLAWERLAACWPDARWVFLLRHPANILQSWVDATDHGPDASAAHLLTFMTALDAARAALPGITVRYEQLVADPAAHVARVCDHLGEPFEPAMLNYGQHGHGPFRRGFGDWSDNINSGRIQTGRPLPPPSRIPHVLRPVCEAWGYA
ncbi:sulfotransferase [Nonomuraea recticatena]|uniref:Sulfotransferase n=2 Tax=Nonomuraea recticatena TaxID=46178 RepID=A0ABP6FI08_9ACTN